MRIIHSELYTVSADAPECVLDIIRDRLTETYGAYKEEHSEVGYFIQATSDSKTEEEKNNGEQIGIDTLCTDGDDKGDQAADGADGYLGMVNDTWSDPV